MALKMRRNPAKAEETKITAQTKQVAEKTEQTPLEAAQKRFIAANQDLQQFRITYDSILTALEQTVSEYNAAVIEFRDQLRKNKVGKTGRFTVFMKENEAVDLTKLRKTCSKLLAYPGVVTKVDLGVARITAETLNLSDALDACVSKTEDKQVRGPNIMELKWPEA